MPLDRLPHLVGHMQANRFGEVLTHPPTGLNMTFCCGFNTFAGQAQPCPQRFGISCPLVAGRPVRPAPRGGVTLQRPP
jgi:hypothetical protein